MELAEYRNVKMLMKRLSDRTGADDLRPKYDLSKLKPAVRSRYPRLVMVSAVSSKGQVTLPAAIGDKMGLVSGSKVTFEILPTGILMRKGRSKR